MNCICKPTGQRQADGIVVRPEPECPVHGTSSPHWPWPTTTKEPRPQPLDTRFDGWVMVAEHSEGVLLQTDIAAIDWDRQSPGLNVPNCINEHSISRGAAYELVNPEEVVYLCTVCVLKLWEGRKVGGYLMGALPAN